MSQLINRACDFLEANPRARAVVQYDREGSAFYVVERYGSELRCDHDWSCATRPYSAPIVWYSRNGRFAEIYLEEAEANGLPD